MHSIVVSHAQLLVRGFTQTHAKALAESGRGLFQLLDQWEPDDTAFESVWDATFGELRIASLEEQARDCVRYASSIALRFHQFGLQGEWSASLNSPATFRFDRWFIRAETALKVSATDGIVSVAVRGGDEWSQTSFQRQANGRWSGDHDPCFPMLERHGLVWNVVPCAHLSRPISERLLAGVETEIGAMPWTAALEAGFLRDCGEARQLIGYFASTYTGWVENTIRSVVPLPLSAGILNSSSSSSAPGLITVTSGNACLLAEMLVHEASHQYFYILSRLGALEDGSDKTLYYSPFRNMGRPIQYILFSYHAFGNLVLFYRDLMRNGLDLRQEGIDLQERSDELLRDLDVVEKALCSTAALTPLGNSLWQPLQDHIRLTNTV